MVVVHRCDAFWVVGFRKFGAHIMEKGSHRD